MSAPANPSPTRSRELSWLLAPLLVATFPVVYLWSSNLRNQILIEDVLLILALVWLGTAACYALFRLIFRDGPRASIATIVIATLILSFGHMARVAPAYPDTGLMKMLLLAYALLGFSALIVIKRARISPRLVGTVSLVSGGLVALNLALIAFSGTPVSARGLPNAGDHVDIEGLSARGAKPDVYYLIFDRYANGDILRTRYGFDNTPFLDGLKERGFTVVDDAVANYPGTTHSLASSLNLSYLDELAGAVGPSSDDWRPLLDSLNGSVAQQAFDRLGYRTVHMGTWWGPTFSDPNADVSVVYRELREFPGVFLMTTMLPYAADELGVEAIPDASEDQFHRIHLQTDSILDVAEDPRPTFTFAHFTLPHSPYVVDAEGNFIPAGGEYVVEDAYVEQLRYTNTLIERIVDGLLAGPSADDPIVILQSDEGPHPIAVDDDPDPMFDWSTEPPEELERKMKIFSAYYLPGGDRGPTPTQTPVNTFRAIFDRYFGGRFPILPDRSWIYVTNEQPYRYEDVSTQLGLPSG